MPTYEYACQKCGHHFEAFQSMTEAPLAKCPKCKKKSLKRLIGTGAGLMFKGAGFYETDYKTKKGAAPAAPDSPAPSGGGGGSCKDCPCKKKAEGPKG